MNNLFFIYFLNAQQVFKTKPISEVTQKDLELLEKLEKEHKIEVEKANQEDKVIFDLNYEGNAPNKQIERQKRDVDLLMHQNGLLKISLYSVLAILIFLIIIIFMKRKRR